MMAFNMRIPTCPRAMQGAQGSTRTSGSQRRRHQSFQDATDLTTSPIEWQRQRPQQQQHLHTPKIGSQLSGKHHLHEQEERETKRQKRHGTLELADPFSSNPLLDFIPFSDESTGEEGDGDDDVNHTELPVDNCLWSTLRQGFEQQFEPLHYHYSTEMSWPAPEPNHDLPCAKGKPGYQSAKPALFELAEAMGYTIRGVSGSTRALVLADALKLLQRVAPHARERDPPEDLRPRLIVNWIALVIPKEFKQVYINKEYGYDEGIVMRAAAEYIHELRKDNSMDLVTSELQGHRAEARGSEPGFLKTGDSQNIDVADMLNEVDR